MKQKNYKRYAVILDFNKGCVWYEILSFNNSAMEKEEYADPDDFAEYLIEEKYNNVQYMISKKPISSKFI